MYLIAEFDGVATRFDFIVLVQLNVLESVVEHACSFDGRGRGGAVTGKLFNDARNICQVIEHVIQTSVQ